MRSVFAFALLASATALSHEDVFRQFADFKVTHQKKYSSPAEMQLRMAIFEENLAEIEVKNAALRLAGEDEVHGVTKFMDLTHEEFKNTYLMTDYTPMPRTEETVYNGGAASVDWRTKGVLTPVKDQGQCGSCWAFSATEAIESYAKLSGKALMELSPQQINSCDTYDHGCNGGNTETAYRYVQSAGGLEDEASYPYTSGTGRTGTCRFDASNIKVSITGYKSIARGESSLEGALTEGPVSVCLAAEAFQTYHGGILSSCPGQIDHCVQAVGYTADYWIVRNSWATGWGEEGFIRIKRGANLCQIQNDVTHPTF